MARIEPVRTEAASSEVREVLDEIEKTFGMVPNLFRTSAHHPPLLKANWEKVKAVMMRGELTRKTKEAIAVLVSKDNSCDYCVTAHVSVLRSMGVTQGEVEKILSKVEKAGFTEKELALIEFARKANRAPLDITELEFEELKGAGATDAEIVEALGVMELYTAFNKFLDSLGVEVDF
ncbi:MAG: peroxidase-related enzyme [Thermodesulfobacteriota bacterium]